MEKEGNQSPSNKEEKPQGGGWGAWGISSLSVFSDLQKAAEEISRHAVAAAKNAAKGITDMEAAAGSDSESADGEQISPAEGDSGKHENDELRKSALDKLERASEDSLFGQGLKVLDSSMDSFASGAWQALGGAWKGGSDLVHKLEHSAANLAESIQQGGLPAKATTLAPSIMETGKSFTLKGMKVLEQVGKETMELLISETGLEVEKNFDEAGQQVDDEQFEEVTFDRCFYIYGGPDQLEELEALSNHHALLFNRRKTKLSSEQKSFYDGKLRQIQQSFSLETEFEENGVDSDKGKNIEMVNIDTDVEMKKLLDSSVSKAADMATGFASALGGLAANEIIQRTSDRLETVHSEGVHRLSELCCFAVSQLLILGKSVISNASKLKGEETYEDTVKIEWPEDSISKAKIIRFKAQSMSKDVERVYNSFSTGISDIVEVYLAAIQSVSSDTHDSLPQQNKIQEKANAISDHLHADRVSALDKIRDALQYLAYVVLSTSMPTV
ncbi:hypothetical protein COCNU_05G000040 [Cocos nucifera]|uniref:DUF7798 domain-containing protein n=1 Tax=Cocos nucifera TaxID=13894 RepID=A0A8K0I792_COCNU|nr:hypothetical protein COCNU_05G000040 [Cocos nucifera]